MPNGYQGPETHNERMLEDRLRKLQDEHRVLNNRYMERGDQIRKLERAVTVEETFANDYRRKLEETERQLRDAWVREVYNEEGARIWVADAEKKGQPISEQLIRLDQLRTGAYA